MRWLCKLQGSKHVCKGQLPRCSDMGAPTLPQHASESWQLVLIPKKLPRFQLQQQPSLQGAAPNPSQTSTGLMQLHTHLTHRLRLAFSHAHLVRAHKVVGPAVVLRVHLLAGVGAELTGGVVLTWITAHTQEVPRDGRWLTCDPTAQRPLIISTSSCSVPNPCSLPLAACQIVLHPDVKSPHLCRGTSTTVILRNTHNMNLQGNQVCAKSN